MTAVMQSKGGRPSKLNDEIEEKIVQAVRNHQSPEVAASLAKVHRTTLYEWLAVANKAQTKLDAGAPVSKLTAHEKRCLEFSDKMQVARDQAEAIAVGSWVSAGIRPAVTKTRKSRVVGTNDANEPIWVTEETVVEAPADWRAVQAWLGVQRRGYHPKQTVELTGADGGPIAVEFVAQLNDVREKINQARDAIAVESQEVE